MRTNVPTVVSVTSPNLPGRRGADPAQVSQPAIRPDHALIEGP